MWNRGKGCEKARGGRMAGCIFFASLLFSFLFLSFFLFLPFSLAHVKRRLIPFIDTQTCPVRVIGCAVEKGG